MYIDLNRFRTRLVTYLLYNYFVRLTLNSLFSTTSAANQKYKLFSDGEFLHDTINDVAQCITCLTNKPNNVINIKCDLGVYDEFPE